MPRTNGAAARSHEAWRPTAPANTSAKYEWVATQLSESIDRHQAGDRLPPESALCELFGVSHMTVRRAIGLLTNSGRVVSVRGKGIYVAEAAVTKAMTNQSFAETMRAHGRVPSARLQRAELREPTAVEAERLDLPRDAQVIHLQRIQFGDHLPMCVEYTTLPAARFPTLLGHDLSGPLYELVESEFSTTIHPVSYRVRAHTLTEEEATWLSLPTDSAALRSQVVGVDGHGATIEATTTTYRGDIYELYFELGTSTVETNINRN